MELKPILLCAAPSQLEEFLNRSSPFSIWINGQNIDTLEKEDQQQRRHFQDLERRYTDVADGVDSIFVDSMKVFDHMRSLHQPGWFHRPSPIYRSLFHDPQFPDFHSMFQPMRQMTQDVFGSIGLYMGGDSNFPSEGKQAVTLQCQCERITPLCVALNISRHVRNEMQYSNIIPYSSFCHTNITKFISPLRVCPKPYSLYRLFRNVLRILHYAHIEEGLVLGIIFHFQRLQSFFFWTDGSVNEDVIITRPFGNDKMTCREIRRNSAGCIKLREECEKCKEIQHIGELSIRSTL